MSGSTSNVFNINSYRKRGFFPSDAYQFESLLEKYVGSMAKYSLNSITEVGIELFVWGRDLDDKMENVSAFAQSKGWKVADWKYDTSDLEDTYFVGDEGDDEDNAIVNLVYVGFDGKIDIAV